MIVTNATPNVFSFIKIDKFFFKVTKKMKTNINKLKNDGHNIFITARRKDVTHQLLDNYNIPYTSRGKGSSSLIGKFFYFMFT